MKLTSSTERDCLSNSLTLWGIQRGQDSSLCTYVALCHMFDLMGMYLTSQMLRGHFWPTEPSLCLRENVSEKGVYVSPAILDAVTFVLLFAGLCHVAMAVLIFHTKCLMVLSRCWQLTVIISVWSVKQLIWEQEATVVIKSQSRLGLK